jgi:hypothetical protein
MYSPDKFDQDNSENMGWTRSYLIELQIDRASPLCQDFEHHSEAIRTVLREIEWRLKDINTPGTPTGALFNGPDLNTLIDWFEAEAQDLIARHRDRDDEDLTINAKLYDAAMARDD